jgi:hypothetical protein
MVVQIFCAALRGAIIHSRLSSRRSGLTAESNTISNLNVIFSMKTLSAPPQHVSKIIGRGSDQVTVALDIGNSGDKAFEIAGADWNPLIVQVTKLKACTREAREKHKKNLKNTESPPERSLGHPV